jgi:uncharacterized membrane protein YkvA (DUF1232 family)
MNVLSCVLYAWLLCSPAMAFAVTGVHGSSSYGYPALSLPLTPQLQAEPFEHRLAVGTKTMLRDARWGLRQSFRVVVGSIILWTSWVWQAAAFTLIVLLWPLLDRGLLETWRQRGIAGVRASVALMLAIYVRLLFDTRTPATGKALLLFAVIYGAASVDLVPDQLGTLAFIDDWIVVAIAYRCFILLCPAPLVEEHARKAGYARERSLRRRRVRRTMMRPNTGDAVGH